MRQKFRALKTLKVCGVSAAVLCLMGAATAQENEAALLNRAVEICSDYSISAADMAIKMQSAGLELRNEKLAWPYQDICLTNQIAGAPGSESGEKPELLAMVKRMAAKSHAHCLANLYPELLPYDPKKVPDIQRVLARFDLTTPSRLGGVTIVSIEDGYEKWQGRSENVKIFNRCYISDRGSQSLDTEPLGLPRVSMGKGDRERAWGEYYRFGLFPDDKNGGVTATYSQAYDHDSVRALKTDQPLPVETFSIVTLQSNPTN